MVCDLDPQASLSQGFFGPRFVEGLPKHVTIGALFDNALDPVPDDLIHETSFENIWIAPASNDLSDHNTPRPESAPSQDCLGDFMSEVSSCFDLILIDCPPNLQLCSWAALLASDFVVIPVIPEDFSSQGLIYVQQAIDLAMTRKNPRLRLLGYMMTMYNRQLGIHKAYEKLLREQYRDLVMEHSFPLATAYKEAVSRRRPIADDKPKSAAAESVGDLATEILDRAPIYRAKPAEFYYAGNRYVEGMALPQSPDLVEMVATMNEEA